MSEIIVISCSNKKNGSNLVISGKQVSFCAKPKLAPKDGIIYVHPDDRIRTRLQKATWREWINSIQEKKDILDSYNLLEAYRLYDNAVYKKLYKKYQDKLYIFSDAWGIIKASYRLPKYNVTFSSGKEKHRMRNSNPPYFNDFNHLLNIKSDDDIKLVAGSDYIIPFCEMTKSLKNKKSLFIIAK